MNQEHPNKQQDLNQPDQNIVKKEYQAPKVTPHGALAELVQANPHVGNDGGTADCSLS